MKSAFICVIAICFVGFITAHSEKAAVSFTDIHKYLSDSLKDVLGTEQVDMESLKKFVNKHENMAPILTKFARTKKSMIHNMPKDFFHGLVYTSVEGHHDYEMSSVDAYIESKDYQKDCKKYDCQCSYHLDLAPISSQITFSHGFTYLLKT